MLKFFFFLVLLLLGFNGVIVWHNARQKNSETISCNKGCITQKTTTGTMRTFILPGALFDII